MSQTEIVHGSDNVVDRLVQFMHKAQLRIDICVDHTRPCLAIEIMQLRDAFIDAKRRHVKIRYLTEITKQNLHYCKQLISVVDEFRHLNGIKGNFYVSEQEYTAPSTLHEEGKSSEIMIYSNVKEIVEHQQYIFDSFWNTSTSAERKITEIQSGISLGITQIIDNPLRTQELFINLVKSAKSEMLLILPTINAFMREHRIGVLQLFKELSTTPEEGRAIDIRILTPTNNAIDKIIEEMKTTTTISTTSVPKGEPISPFSSNKDNNSHLRIRYLEPELNVTTVTILVVDRKASLVIEKVDDSKESFIEAVGLSTYSTSEPTVISYLSIFENFWNQIELYQQVKEANERLTLHDKMQQEFINVAAHELRTPIQPILSTVGLIRSSNQALIRKEELDDSINMIARNATRLKQLSEDILDVTKIESQSLNLRKEVCDLNDIVRNSIDEYNRNQVIRSKKNIVIKYTSYEDKVFVEVDRNRIAQIISHLLNNAFKFTKEGSILVNIVLDQKGKQVIVSVKDSGRGIDPEVFSRLFQKFASKSFQGTGLGLFISRSIIEAHGGRIWAENNSDGRGTTFYFTLPVIKRLQQQPTYFM